MDNVAYFLDIAREASQLTKLMGDMGAVLLEPQLQKLLSELDDKALRLARHLLLSFFFPVLHPIRQHSEKNTLKRTGRCFVRLEGASF